MINLILIAIALSMDTFSLSLSLGTYTKNKILNISLTVGLMHFLMPLLGCLLGERLLFFLRLNSNLFLGLILLFIGINLLIDTLKKEERVIDLTPMGINLFAFGVSIDAFSTGLALKAITSNRLLAMSIFAITSFLFTFFGLKIGNIIYKKIGNKANIIGLVILFYLAFFHIKYSH